MWRHVKLYGPVAAASLWVLQRLWAGERKEDGERESYRVLSAFRQRVALCDSSPYSTTASTTQKSRDGTAVKKKGGVREREQVLMWGRKEALPNGNTLVKMGETTVGHPIEPPWFRSHSLPSPSPSAASAATEGFKWRRLAFGPFFGIAASEDGRLFLWGSVLQPSRSPSPPPSVSVSIPTDKQVEKEKAPTKTKANQESQTKAKANQEEPVYVSPFELDLRSSQLGPGSPVRVADVGCSREGIWVLSTGGVMFFFDRVESLLQEALAVGGVESGQAGTGEKGKDKEADMKKRERSAPTSPPRAIVQCDLRLVEGLPRPSWWPLSWNRVESFSVGFDHACFVTSEGRLLCGGNNKHGQCGHEPTEKEEATGTSGFSDFSVSEVGFSLPGGNTTPRITQVACGESHTVCLDEGGNAFAFGDDSRVQLSLGDSRHSQGAHLNRPIVFAPTRTKEPPTGTKPLKPCHAIRCGGNFSVFVHGEVSKEPKEKESNIVACSGDNANGQCGRSFHQRHQTLNFTRTPKFVLHEDIRCGRSHCLAHLRDGRVFGWGHNVQSQVGLGAANRLIVLPPKEVPLSGEEERGEGHAQGRDVNNAKGEQNTVEEGKANSSAPSSAQQPPPSSSGSSKKTKTVGGPSKDQTGEFSREDGKPVSSSIAAPSPSAVQSPKRDGTERRSTETPTSSEGASSGPHKQIGGETVRKATSTALTSTFLMKEAMLFSFLPHLYEEIGVVLE
uniref:Regulator of chromosome condensation (RCC1) repeat-containing protein n=1 Tax=Chromera velia CCMP2878 TaxID=1169474 RepID=A0A0G4GE54_9ALVE|eukprot:Cvel_21478.t1-p1 / transcript=Cvel_21478.t1 / gene=Cvel_21478 / organism=Chromera_velia_CCMP2878 / gene_product=Probable E3 ubiquitin-protein ligase HERC1, putative / transcript_product=Probable E3 ubiquitin-protein ligase HERC1, putative / location=Cvel_scaffold2017:4050-12699(-) / protein_length=729 / sequence_SO=supercontig / SO=protein_coding / is_pseudo=false